MLEICDMLSRIPEANTLIEGRKYEDIAPDKNGNVVFTEKKTTGLRDLIESMKTDLANLER